MIRESLPAIRRAILESAGIAVDAAPESVGGGCIHEAFRLGAFFVKMNRPQCLPMFEAEAVSPPERKISDMLHWPFTVCQAEIFPRILSTISGWRSARSFSSRGSCLMR